MKAPIVEEHIITLRKAIATANNRALETKVRLRACSVMRFTIQQLRDLGLHRNEIEELLGE